MFKRDCGGGDRRKDLMINHNESELHRPGIESCSPDADSNTLPIVQRRHWIKTMPVLL
jgi:hypothetical protein